MNPSPDSATRAQAEGFWGLGRAETLRLLPIFLPVTLAGLAALGASAGAYAAAPPAPGDLIGTAVLLAAAIFAEAYPVPVDRLPAGFEIEAVVNDETAKSFPFLGELTATRVSEGRDDRFFAAFNLGTRTYRTWWDSELRNPNRFNVAYIVRAVTPGSFALPAVNVSDMYAPRIHARSAMGRVTIAPR